VAERELFRDIESKYHQHSAIRKSPTQESTGKTDMDDLSVSQNARGHLCLADKTEWIHSSLLSETAIAFA
jgi:hypothetical protein